MTQATIYRSRSVRVDVTGHGEPVLAEEISVISAGLKAGAVLAFAEALKLAEAGEDALVMIEGPVGDVHRKNLRCTWRRILPTSGDTLEATPE